MPKNCRFEEFLLLFTYYSQPALNPYNSPSLKVHTYSHYHPIQGRKRLASGWVWAFILSRVKNGDNDQVSHSNCIAYATGAFDEKDERAYTAPDDTIFNVPLRASFLAGCGTSRASLSTSLRAACLTQIVVVSFEGVYLKASFLFLMKGFHFVQVSHRHSLHLFEESCAQ